MNNVIPLTIALALLGGASVAHAQVAMPGTASAETIRDVAIGDGAKSTGSGVALGANSTAAQQGIAAGTAAIATGEQSTAIGAEAQALGAHSIALGARSKATGTNSVAIGWETVVTRDNAVSMGLRQVVGVADATQLTDAVNLRQVMALSGSIRPGVARADFDALAGKVTSLESNVSLLRKESMSGIASAAALAQPVAFSRPGTTAYTVGTARYMGETALAIGAHHLTESTSLDPFIKRWSGVSPVTVVYSGGISTNSAKKTLLRGGFSFQVE
jgi:autotransporter adhesin